MDVPGSLWMAPRAGVEVGRKFLTALIARTLDELNTPKRTPRRVSLQFSTFARLVSGVG